MAADEQGGGSREPELQFDEAEFVGPNSALACAACSQPIEASYFQMGVASVCPPCRVLVEQVHARKPGVSGFLRAGIYGTLAAGAGSLLYFGIGALTGYNFGLIAIVVGVMVGKAVRKGSGNRGGVLFQLLAVFLTYGSIVSTYIPEIIAFIAEEAQKKSPEAADVKAGAPPQGRTAEEGSPGDETRRSLGENLAYIAAAALVLFGVAFAIPFLSLSEGSNAWIGLIIIGIGLMEAWKANQWVDVKFEGPFELQPTGETITAASV